MSANPYRLRSLMRRLAALIAAVLPAFLSAQNGNGSIRLTFPDPDPGGPVYARVERPFLVHDGQYAAIVFYRDPACVPEDFNLLDNVDLEGFPFDARAFRCPVTVEGFQLWTSYPFPGPPNLVFTQGTGAVPVWLVAWAELQSALTDDELTIGELRSMASLQTGYATHFQETLKLSPSAQTQSLNFIASGAISDGKSFLVNYVFRNGVVEEVQVSIR